MNTASSASDGRTVCAIVRAATVSSRPDFLTLISIVQQHGSLAADCEPIYTDDLDPAYPLHVCCKHGKADYVGLLLQRGANPNRADRSGLTALMFAASARCLRSVHMLLRAGANPSVESHDGRAPLLIAARYGHFDVSLALLRGGADVHARSITGHSALAYAAAYGSYPLARLLVEYGASVTAVTYDGDSVAEIAAQHGHGTIACWLNDSAMSP
jgi:uncharacterized protein